MTYPFIIPLDLELKFKTLEALLSPYPSFAVAYSGGVDSTFLAWYVQKVLGKRLHAFLVQSPFLGRRERERAQSLAREIGFSLETLFGDPIAVPSIRENSSLRCYFCKKESMTAIKERAHTLGYAAVLEGSHAGDSRSYRPGRRALKELHILSPLATAGFEKSEIREVSRLAGLSNWDLPSQSCLATRIPYGTAITSDLLSRIEEAESYLWEVGCRQVRVRIHENLARIEVTPEDFPLFMEKNTREKLLRRFKELNFAFVSLDLAGYRSGSGDKINP
ncbi:ATP-dependent sacrificial sulfur transferase LarE [Desulforhabdus amnigena]|jgi:uncharacterized protein|uniref:Adenine nucleotide alpha hydrolase n=1 Tax=Desulforhabdus amnigena TaxID=40218 RepID=A0A9W6LAJ3_9BACT|nr:ATP-dependent sacrificial sulfur transferase LarE [Desulforhabdus amnigena]NLJ28294.1 ATP-dependent sacrificial sulfur transferase LarE [Deltaproteobacteria bacterium]GLI36120.1 adenine nucleotide alpha hydrolase [Desulforhabdus amnigena]